MHTALPQHGREIKGLCLFSVNVRPYSVKNPHIDSFILRSMHYMPTCFQQKWYICEWSWPCERKSVQNVENQASVTQGKKERQLWRQKHSTVQGQSQPIECRFFFVLCSFTLSACLVPVGISRIASFWLDGEITKAWSGVCMSYFDLMAIYSELL